MFFYGIEPLNNNEIEKSNHIKIYLRHEDTCNSKSMRLALNINISHLKIMKSHKQEIILTLRSRLFRYTKKY